MMTTELLVAVGQGQDGVKEEWAVYSAVRAVRLLDLLHASVPQLEPSAFGNSLAVGGRALLCTTGRRSSAAFSVRVLRAVFRVLTPIPRRMAASS
eukprot:1297991-Rhodomonas_salina.4